MEEVFCLNNIDVLDIMENEADDGKRPLFSFPCVEQFSENIYHLLR